VRPLLSTDESRALDAAAATAGGGSEALVERAARGMATRLGEILDRISGGGAQGRRRVTALAGRGANGADALAALRVLRERGRTEAMTAVLAFSPGRGDGPADAQSARLESLGIEILDFAAERNASLEAVSSAELLLEGLAGTGAVGALREPAAGLVEAANRARGFRVAVDLPAGLGSGGAVFEADATLMVAPPKELAFRPSLRAYSGTIHFIDGVFEPGAGSGSAVHLPEEADLPGLVPRLAPDDHKGRRGGAGIWAGAVGTTGAASLACRGAVAAGCGLARLRARTEIWQALASRIEDGLVAPLGRLRDEAAFAAGMDALLAGPGWGRSAPAPALLRRLLETELPLVLDADALGLLGTVRGKLRRKAPLILTPHPGELARLAGVPVEAVLDDPLAVARPLADRYGAVVCVRAVATWIAAPGGRAFVVDGFEPSLAVAGSGDVFAGLLVGLLARARAGDPERLDPAALAAAAALAHASAGRALAGRLGFYGASDLAAELGSIIHRASSAERRVPGRRLRP